MDSAIIALIKKDHAEGLKLAMTTYMPIVKTVVKRVLRDQTEDVEEVVADTFVKFWQAAAGGECGFESIKAYLVCIARNLAINRYHYLKRRNAVSLEGLDDILPDETDVELEIMKNECTQTLLDAIDRLPEPNREIIIRRYFLFEPVKVVAAQLGLKPTQVTNRIHQAKTQLSRNDDLKGVSI